MRGWETVRLDNDELSAVLLPGRGGEIHSLEHRPTGAELLWSVPWQTPEGPRVPAGVDFHDWYLGGWQDLFPNGDGPCTVDGVEHERHGEAWRLPWRTSVDGGRATLEVELGVLPLRARRVVTLDGATLHVEEAIEHAGDAPLRLMWGHHPAWGGDLVEEGTRVDLPGGRVECYGAQVDATSRLADRGSSAWPLAPGRAGEPVDVSVVPGPEARSHDVAVITDLADGWYAVRNPRRGIGVALRFPASTFRWLWMWQPYGGASTPPFDRGAYSLALEPWTSPPGLERAAARGAEVRLDPGERLEATLEATVFAAGERPVRRVAEGGRVDV